MRRGARHARAAVVATALLLGASACTGDSPSPSATDTSSTAPASGAPSGDAPADAAPAVTGPGGRWTASGPGRSSGPNCVSVTRRGESVHVTVPAGLTQQDEGPVPLAALRYQAIDRGASLRQVALYAWTQDDDSATTVTRRMAVWFDGETQTGIDDIGSTTVQASDDVAGASSLYAVQQQVAGSGGLPHAVSVVTLLSGAERFGVATLTRRDADGEAARHAIERSFAPGPCP
ncbi:hypothetical protein [Angustibacter aerolatus]